MGIRSWSQTGYSYHHNTTSPASLTTSFQAFEVTQDLTNNTGSKFFPDSANIQTVELDFTVKGSASTVTMYLARDSNGNAAITPGATTGATATLTAGTGTTANAVFQVNTDYNYDETVSSSKRYSLYVMAKVDDATGSPKANIRVNWRQ